MRKQWETLVSLRPFQKQDLEQAMAIEQISFRAPWTREMFLKELELKFAYHRMASLNSEGEIAGYIFCWLMEPEASILSVAVRPDWRRRGLAGYLLLSALDDFQSRGIREVWLEVRPSNFPARSLYRAFEFQPVGIRPKYYYDTGEDAIVMKLKLGSGLDL